MTTKSSLVSRAFAAWTTLAALALLAVPAYAGSGCGSCPYSKGTEAAKETKTIAYVVKVHKDSCGACQVIEPTLVELREEYKGQPVKFLVFDHTSDESKAASATLAEKYGLKAIYDQYGQSGQVLIIKASAKDTVATVLKKDNTVADYRVAISTVSSARAGTCDKDCKGSGKSCG